MQTQLFRQAVSCKERARFNVVPSEAVPCVLLYFPCASSGCSCRQPGRLRSAAAPGSHSPGACAESSCHWSPSSKCCCPSLASTPSCGLATPLIGSFFAVHKEHSSEQPELQHAHPNTSTAGSPRAMCSIYLLVELLLVFSLVSV